MPMIGIRRTVSPYARPSGFDSAHRRAAGVSYLNYLEALHSHSFFHSSTVSLACSRLRRR